MTDQPPANQPPTTQPVPTGPTPAPGAVPTPGPVSASAPTSVSVGGAATMTAPTPYLPRWGVQTGFLQRRQPAFWLFVILLVFTALTILNEQFVYLQYFPAGWIFSVVLLALYVVPVFLAIYLLDLFEREPLTLIIAAFVWGGVIATGLAVVVNTALLEALAKLFGANFAQSWGVALVAPPVEETLKYLGIVTIYLIARTEIDDLLDGFIYGAIIGLGFAAVENVQYFIRAVAGGGGGDELGPVLQMFTIRALLIGPYMHVLWTGITGLGFAYYVTQVDQPRQKRLMYAVGLFLLGMLAHIVWNSPMLTNLLTGFGGIVVFGIIKGLPFLIFLALLVVLAQRRERRWFQTFTARDLGTDLLTQAEMAELSGLRSRWSARRRVAATKGSQGGKLYGQLQREQINLAMIRARAGRDDDPNVEAQRNRIRTIKSQLNALPNVVQPAPTPYVAPALPGGQPAAGPSAFGGQPASAHPAASAYPAAPPHVAAPAPPPPAMTWTPTHAVPPMGMPAWANPDPAVPPVTQLAGGVPLIIAEQNGAWARVVASNNWSGWVDGRLLTRLR